MPTRDLVGYGASPPHLEWPGGARLALNFVLNYEEGAERTPLDGDEVAETYGAEFPLAAKPPGVRSLSMESLFEYGSRAGVWRILRLFEENELPLTVFATGLALQRNLELARHLAAKDHEVCGHGWRWIDYASVPRDEERQDILRTIEVIEAQIGRRPVGWYTGRRSAHTRELLLDIGGFLYDSESYADDLPYFVQTSGQRHLVIPYTLDCNDFRFCTSPGFSCSRDFLHHLQDAFDTLYSEGASAPRMMTVALHGRISGRPARAAVLARFIDHVRRHDHVWLCRREDIARHMLRKFAEPAPI